MKKRLLERYGFGVMADTDDMPKIFTHSDRFLVMDLKDRKEVIFEEYRPNPYGEICRTKYTMPTDHRILDEEYDIYKSMAEIIKDCETTIGYNLGYFPKMAFEKAGIFYILKSYLTTPREHINSLIENRVYAGFRD